MKPLKKSFFALFMLVLALPATKVRVLTFEQLERSVQKNNDTLYIVNFWATWCRPCVHEFPYFMESARKFSGEKVKVIFTSLNSVKEMPGVQKFADAKNVQQDVFILNAGNPNIWIDKVDNSWGGSIPATIMYKNNKKVFFREGEFTQTELDSIINSKIK